MFIIEAGDDIEDIKQEVAILSELQSPYVTKYHASYVHGTKLWIIMEYCSNGSCLDLVKIYFVFFLIKKL